MACRGEAFFDQEAKKTPWHDSGVVASLEICLGVKFCLGGEDLVCSCMESGSHFARMLTSEMSARERSDSLFESEDATASEGLLFRTLTYVLLLILTVKLYLTVK